jgi:hypothetical protein
MDSNLIANCSNSKKWQMTLVRQNNDSMYVAVWSAKFIGLVTIQMLDRKSMISGWDLLSVLHDSWWNCSWVLSCQCYILIKNCCDNWCVRSLTEMEPVCSLPSSHKLQFLTTGLGDHKSWQLVWYSSVPPVSWPLPHLHPGLHTFILPSSRGVNSHKQNPGSCIYVRHIVTINS